MNPFLPDEIISDALKLVCVAVRWEFKAVVICKPQLFIWNLWPWHNNLYQYTHSSLLLLQNGLTGPLKVIWLTQVLNAGLEIHIKKTKGGRSVQSHDETIQYIAVNVSEWNWPWRHKTRSDVKFSVSLSLATAVCCNICLPPPHSMKRPGTTFLNYWRHVALATRNRHNSLDIFHINTKIKILCKRCRARLNQGPDQRGSSSTCDKQMKKKLFWDANNRLAINYQ